jgi:alpha-amylase
MDAVKHFTPEFVGDMLDELHDNSMSPQIVVGEVFDLTASVLAGWVNSVYTYMDNDTKNSISPRVFDFALRDHLRKACDETATSDTRNIYSNSVVATGLSGYNVVTFINNHDFRDNSGYSSLIQNDAILAYAYILTNNQVGVPMVFYPDYFGYPTDETKFPYFPSNKAPLSDDIDKLISVNNNYIYGSTSIDELNRYSTPYSSNYISGNAYQSLIYQLSGGVAGKEVIVAINFSGVNLQVDHEIGMYNGLMAGSQLYDIVGNSAHPYAQVNSSNQIYIDLPPRSWSVWVQGNPVVPLSPTQLTINDASSDRISISWTDNSPNEDNFVIERKIGLNGTWAQLGMVDANLTTFVDSSAFSNSIDYFYRVYSTNAAGNSSATNEVLTKPYVAWQGYSGEWNSALNWLPPVIPDSNCDVIIPSSNEGGHSPTTVAGDYGSIKSLKLESGVEFIIPSGKTLEINE